MSNIIAESIKDFKLMIEEDKELKTVVCLGIGIISVYVLYNSLSSENKTVCGFRLLSQAINIGII